MGRMLEIQCHDPILMNDSNLQANYTMAALNWYLRYMNLSEVGARINFLFWAPTVKWSLYETAGDKREDGRPDAMDLVRIHVLRWHSLHYHWFVSLASLVKNFKRSPIFAMLKVTCVWWRALYKYIRVIEYFVVSKLIPVSFSLQNLRKIKKLSWKNCTKHWWKFEGTGGRLQRRQLVSSPPAST